ncbi:MAG: hemerythrin domain-containing protein [Nostoc sp. S4]|nr:hemerythrin domain-containing protein [Nostoc sp. S4]
MAKTKATDILLLIEAEHRQVEQLFVEAEKAKGSKLYEYFSQIYKILSLHSRTEELIFYPALEEYEETEQYVDEAEEEHEEISFILEEIKVLRPNNPEFQDKMNELKELFQYHVEQEEGEIFTAIRECMNEEELTELGEQFQKAKTELKPEVEAALSF